MTHDGMCSVVGDSAALDGLRPDLDSEQLRVDASGLVRRNCIRTSPWKLHDGEVATCAAGDQPDLAVLRSGVGSGAFGARVARIAERFQASSRAAIARAAA